MSKVTKSRTQRTNITFNEISENDKSMEPDSKTQNTHDYRNKEELALEEFEFNFSDEKAVNKFTRMDIFPHQMQKPRQRKVSDELECDLSWEIMNTKSKMLLAKSRYEDKSYEELNESVQHNIDEFEESPPIHNIVFSDEKVYNKDHQETK